MRHLTYRIVLALAFTTIAASVDAAIQASSYLQISDFIVTKAAGPGTGSPITADTLAFPVLGSDITIVGIVDVATANANLNGGPGDSNVFPGLDVPVASDSPPGFLGAAFENDFTSPLIPPSFPYARADSDGSGTIATILPGPVTTGATVDTISDVYVDNLSGDLGNSSTTVTSSTVFFNVATPLSLTLDFMALLDITLDYPLPPSGVVLSGSTSFEALIIGTGVTVGGVTSGTFTFAPAVLNTGLLMNSTAGTVGGASFSGPFTSPMITLAPGTYSFTLTQGTTAEIGVVPEPVSILTWTMLSLSVAALSARSWRKR